MVFDLSHQLDNTIQIYPGDPPYISKPFTTISEHGYNVLELHMGSHTGTHVDAPSHYYKEGKNIDEIDPALFIGKAVVINVTGKAAREVITWEDVKHYNERIQPGVMVLFRTDWSRYWKTPQYFDHPYISGDVAKQLMERGVSLIGVDTLNPDLTPRDGEDSQFLVHETVLGAGCLIVENLTNLDQIQDKNVIASFLPIKVSGGDGAPIRAVAWLADSF